jgi:stress response protein YsnF
VVKEVVVIRKRVVQEDRVVEADLRRERIDVDRRDTPG